MVKIVSFWATNVIPSDFSPVPGTLVAVGVGVGVGDGVVVGVGVGVDVLVMQLAMCRNWGVCWR